MEDDQKHKCKICWKRFFNGRALGGHMRSHMLNHPLPESASSSSESSKKPTRKRSRLNRRSIYVETAAAEEIKMRVKTSQEASTESCTEQEPVSSVSDVAEEDVAFSLMMLSRDKWEEKKKWFECETCEKVFKSYQALGGHRASHKKKRALEGSSNCVNILVSEEKEKKKTSRNGHECPICLKVFSSGQALGGHKRSHANSPAKRGFIDLNLPAPSEDEDLVSCVF